MAQPRLKWEEGVSQLRNSCLSPGKPWGEESPSKPHPRATVTTAALALGHAPASGMILHPSCFRTPLCSHDFPHSVLCAGLQPASAAGNPGFIPLRHIRSRSFKPATEFVKTGR